jgi:hemoglobin
MKKNCKRDIETVEDIKLMVDSFYHKVSQDKLIGPFFEKTNWNKHLATMYNFWDNAIFYSGTYNGNPMKSHTRLHEKNPLSKKHFSQWNKLFTQTVDELFEGEKAELAKRRGTSISVVMQTKIVGNNASPLSS